MESAMRTLVKRRAAVAEKYQRSARKSTKKCEVVGNRQLAVRVPLELVVATMLLRLPRAATN